MRKGRGENEWRAESTEKMEEVGGAPVGGVSLSLFLSAGFVGGVDG